MVHVFFGQGWLVFIDGFANYHRCHNADFNHDPCKWLNTSNTSIVPLDSRNISNVTTDINVGVQSSLAEPSGSVDIMALPGILAIISLFFVNTVEHYHLRADSGLSDWNQIFIKVPR